MASLRFSCLLSTVFHLRGRVRDLPAPPLPCSSSVGGGFPGDFFVDITYSVSLDFKYLVLIFRMNWVCFLESKLKARLELENLEIWNVMICQQVYGGCVLTQTGSFVNSTEMCLQIFPRIIQKFRIWRIIHVDVKICKFGRSKL